MAGSRGKDGLTVEEVEPRGECGKWPCEVTWPDETGQRHRYRFETVSVSRGPSVPVYKVVSPDEPDA